MGRLQNRVAFITGGARGIGAATAFLFAKEGAKVGIVDLREEGLQKISADAEQKGIGLSF